MDKLFLVIFLFLTISSCSNEEDEDPRVIFNDALIYQTEFEHPAGHIIRFWTDSNYVYISSAPDFKIHIYNHQGKFIKFLGKKGNAPSENDALWYFTIDETQKRYWVHDYAKQSVKLFSLNSDSLLLTRKTITINNVVYIKKGKFIIPRIDERNGSFLLSIYDTEMQNYIKDYDLLKLAKNKSLKNSKYLDFVFSGNFCSDSNNVVYFCNSVGLFFVINTQDLSIHTIEDIRNLPIPKAIVRNKEIHIEPKQVASISASLYKDYLYSLSTKKTNDIRKSGKFLIDIYNIHSKKHLGSFEIKKRNGEDTPKRISIFKDKLFVQFGNEIISIYKINFTSE